MEVISTGSGMISARKGEKDFRFNAVNLLNCDKEISPESSSDFVMHWAL